jgi:hypothetical protein
MVIVIFPPHIRIELGDFCITQLAKIFLAHLTILTQHSRLRGLELMQQVRNHRKRKFSHLFHRLKSSLGLSISDMILKDANSMNGSETL